MKDRTIWSEHLESLYRRIEAVLESLSQLAPDPDAAGAARAVRQRLSGEDRRAILEQAEKAREQARALHKQYSENRERFLELIGYRGR